MARIVEIVGWGEHGKPPVTQGYFLFSQGKVKSKPLPGFELMFDRLKEEKHMVDGKPVTITSNPQKWIDSLQSEFARQSMIGARVLE